ncbi:uncharacterized protein LOC119866730 isoform X1 [Canis lupus familiaris]|uniref:uncharacterized protein LOC119866730 isoform X1 n=1 Tax=Canis lupus familiaris TaxID=9615 RepID=UPI0018F2D3C0|nr:uncharacterized protein LOC119866730 isoform X1 [Canis lupus familiaris]
MLNKNTLVNTHLPTEVKVTQESQGELEKPIQGIGGKASGHEVCHPSLRAQVSVSYPTGSVATETNYQTLTLCWKGDLNPFCHPDALGEATSGNRRRGGIQRHPLLDLTSVLGVLNHQNWGPQLYLMDEDQLHEHHVAVQVFSTDGRMKMLLSCLFSLRAESSHPLLVFIEPSQKSSQSLYLFPWFRSAPCIHSTPVVAFLSKVHD